MNKANKQFREKYKCPLDGMVNLKMKKPETFDKTRETKKALENSDYSLIKTQDYRERTRRIKNICLCGAGKENRKYDCKKIYQKRVLLGK
jgi:hypothetical protein